MVSTMVLASAGVQSASWLWFLCGLALVAFMSDGVANWMERRTWLAALLALAGALVLIMWDFDGCWYWVCWLTSLPGLLLVR